MSVIAAAIAGLTALASSIGSGAAGAGAAGAAGAAGSAAGAGAAGAAGAAGSAASAGAGISKFLKGLGSSFKSLPKQLGQGFKNSWEGFKSGNLKDVANFGKSALDMLGLGSDVAAVNEDTDTASQADKQEAQVEQLRRGAIKNCASRQIDFLSRIISSTM